MDKQKRLKYRKSVFVVTYYRPNKSEVLYLLLKRKLHWVGWEFPKGGVENNESLIQAVKRESREETGQRVFNIKKYKNKGKYKYGKTFIDRKGVLGQTYTLFSAEIKNPKIKIDKKEHSANKFLPLDKAEKALKWRNQKRCLKTVGKSIKPTKDKMKSIK